jgi:phage recombination protein Bet
MNSVTKANLPALQMPENELIDVLRNSLYPGAKPESIKLVLGYCRARGLDPMKKPVHVVPMYNREAGGVIDVVMPGVNSYRTDAARTGEYVGKSEPEYGPDTTKSLGGVETTFPLWCKIVVKRLIHGKECEFVAKEYWLENYATKKRDTQAPNDMWFRRPYGQLAKCAEAQALRMAFPEETGGTNTNDEMEGKTFAGTTIDSDAPPVEVKPVARKPAHRDIEDSIPDFEQEPAKTKPPTFDEMVDGFIYDIAVLQTKDDFEAIQPKARRFFKMLESAGHDALKDKAVQALADACPRFYDEAQAA